MFTAECRCSKHEGTIWFSANRWQAARWCHTHSLVCSFIHSFKDLYSTSSRKLLRGVPDSSTVKKNSFGRYMAWDTTVVHTCAASYLSQTAISAGSAAEQAAVRKTAKYALLPATHLFVPIAFKTLGPVNNV